MYQIPWLVIPVVARGYSRPFHTCQACVIDLEYLYLSQQLTHTASRHSASMVLLNTVPHQMLPDGSASVKAISLCSCPATSLAPVCLELIFTTA